MHGTITINLDDGRVLQGNIIFDAKHGSTPHATEHGSRSTSMPAQGKSAPKGSLEEAFMRLKEKGFFADHPIVTTSEFVDALHMKCNKKIEPSNATRDLGKLVEKGLIDREEAPVARGRPTQIWYLHNTDKAVIEEGKKRVAAGR